MSDFGEMLRRLRKEQGWSVRQLAARANCGKSTVHDLETDRRPPSTAVVAALDHALSADGTLVAVAGRRVDPLTEVFGTGKEDDVWRRDFLKHAGAMGTDVAAAIGVGPLHSDTGGRERLRAHRDLRQAHGRLDNLCGAGAVYSQAVPHHQALLTWHASVRSASERRRIAALIADTGGFVGFLSNDLGMPAQAVDHYRQAAEYAREADDISCCANLLGQTARIRADQHDYRGALRISDTALDMAGTAAHPSVRAWLHAVRAHHHAGLADAPAAQQDLKTAWTLLERCDDGELPGYMGYMDAPELGKWTGHVMAHLGPRFVKSGLTALDETLAHWPTSSVRGSAEVLTVAARLRAANGDTDEANILVSRAISTATTTGSARNLRSALAVQHGLLGGTAQ